MSRAGLAFAILAFGLSFTVAGCGGTDRLAQLTPAEAYQQGKELYDRGRYNRAVEYFQRVFDFGRAHEWAPDAQYYLARSYFNTRQYLLAANQGSGTIVQFRIDTETGKLEATGNVLEIPAPVCLKFLAVP
jgi:outer membrane protein assembly factor BamD